MKAEKFFVVVAPEQLYPKSAEQFSLFPANAIRSSLPAEVQDRDSNLERVDWTRRDKLCGGHGNASFIRVPSPIAG